MKKVQKKSRGLMPNSSKMSTVHSNRKPLQDNIDIFDGRGKGFLFQLYKNSGNTIRCSSNRFIHDLEEVDIVGNLVQKIEVQIDKDYRVTYGSKIKGQTCICIPDRKVAYLKEGDEVLFYSFNWKGSKFRYIYLSLDMLLKHKRINLPTQESPETGEPFWLVLLEDWSPVHYMKDYL